MLCRNIAVYSTPCNNLLPMKEEWFIKWLQDEGYSFWYEYNGNEVWQSTKFVLVWHLEKGVRFQIANEDYSEEYIQSLL